MKRLIDPDNPTRTYLVLHETPTMLIALYESQNEVYRWKLWSGTWLVTVRRVVLNRRDGRTVTSHWCAISSTVYPRPTAIVGEESHDT